MNLELNTTVVRVCRASLDCGDGLGIEGELGEVLRIRCKDLAR